MELCEFNLETYIPHLWEPTSLEKLTLVDQSPLIVKLESRIKYIWAIMCQIAKGVAFIHQQKEVHRDLKPRNGNSLLIST
jgi:serine/threonine protein kinase